MKTFIAVDDELLSQRIMAATFRIVFIAPAVSKAVTAALGACFRTQPDHVFLDGGLFPGHESPPSLACGDRDSEIPVMINDEGE
jgi:hypothetical protein